MSLQIGQEILVEAWEIGVGACVLVGVVVDRTEDSVQISYSAMFRQSAENWVRDDNFSDVRQYPTARESHFERPIHDRYEQMMVEMQRMFRHFDA